MSEPVVPVPASPLRQPQGPEETRGAAPAPLPPPPRSRRLGRIVRGALLVLLGIVLGAGLTLGAIHRRVKSFIAHPETVPGWITDRLDRRLHFTPDQRGSVLRIVRDRQAEVRRVHLAAAADVEALLTPEQRKTWEEILKRLSVR